ncbi:MAG: 50S ribosomal protein L30 [Alphaproteobacteria bacterium CG_4_10_14_0_2_um_filter_63_37]|nr:MAG: 50S ribosomal protein L30 [Proteobacteria bacterium CG1_02_64_396]PJA25570.1 MAG: 50S ribosomal protein L30 [Alphaproteobacteria bacterium CG_4_10_14_0_2_um_filter_63_37]
MAGLVKVTQVNSSIGYPERVQDTLRGLGLKRRGNSRVLKDTPEVQGMINKVRHLIAVEAVAEGDQSK